MRFTFHFSPISYHLSPLTYSGLFFDQMKIALKLTGILIKGALSGRRALVAIAVGQRHLFAAADRAQFDLQIVPPAVGFFGIKSERVLFSDLEGDLPVNAEKLLRVLRDGRTHRAARP